MTTIEVLEGLMLVCFSVSWYWSIAKMLRTGVATGKSLQFALMILLGYGFGVASKLLMWIESAQFSSIICLYSWNILVISLDAALVMHLSRQAEADCDRPTPPGSRTETVAVPPPPCRPQTSV